MIVSKLLGELVRGKVVDDMTTHSNLSLNEHRINTVEKYATLCSIESRQHIPNIIINNIRKRSLPIKNTTRPRKKFQKQALEEPKKPIHSTREYKNTKPIQLIPILS
jgi:hypothetical protein